MAQYTMELRKLVESGFQVFDDTWDTFIPEHKQELCEKILRHYWYREIGSETPERFKHYLNEQLMFIMPYYNQLYESELIKIMPLYNYVMENDNVSEAERSIARSIATRKDSNALREMADSIKRLTSGSQNITGKAGLTKNETWHEDIDGTSSLTHDEDTTSKTTMTETENGIVDGSEDTSSKETQATEEAKAEKKTGQDKITFDESTTQKEVTSDKLDGTKDTTQETTTSGTNTRRYSDTPQAQITQTDMNIERAYLTNYTRDTNSQDTDTTTKEVLANTEAKTVDTTGTKKGSDTTDKTEDNTVTTDTTKTTDTTAEKKHHETSETTTNGTSDTTGSRDYTEKGTEHQDRDGTRGTTQNQTSQQDLATTGTEKQFQNGSTRDQQSDVGYTSDDTGDKSKTKVTGVVKGITQSQAKLLNEYRSTFINIDAQIIVQLDSNFMGVF